MNKLFMMVVCAATLLSVACSPRQKQTATKPSDFVAVSLGVAAEQAHSDLAMLAKLRGQGIQPLLPPPDPALGVPVSVSWTGPAEGVLKNICLQVGYRYQEVGKPSAQELIVVVHGSNRPAYQLIEDVAWQVQPHGVVRVDPINRVVTLARANVSTGRM